MTLGSFTGCLVLLTIPKYYNDYLNRINATMHLNHKPGELMQVDWAGDTASVIDTDTGEIMQEMRAEKPI